MKNAAPPERALLHDYDIGLAVMPAGPVRASLVARRADVGVLHEHYAAVRGRPHLMTSTLGWEKADKLAQLALYPLTNRGRPLEDLRGVVLKAAAGRCLLCGTDRPTSLDHVLPKGKHPALSVLPLNLIGACEPCNRQKRSTCLADPERQFVHPYFDTLLRDVPWLQCTPLSEDGLLSPTFRIEQAAGMDPELTKRLGWQFDYLKLDDYFASESILYCREQATGWLEVLEGGEDDLRLVLDRELRSVSRPSGANVYKAAFLRGLLSDPVFMSTARDVLEVLFVRSQA